jgi:hypothetical protein
MPHHTPLRPLLALALPVLLVTCSPAWARVEIDPSAAGLEAAKPPAASPDTTAAKAEQAALAKLFQEAEQLFKDKKWPEALAKYNEVLQQSPTTYTSLYRVACCQAMLGKKAEAIASLQKAVDGGFLFFAQLANEPALKPLLDEKGVKDILADKEKRLQANADQRAGIYKGQFPTYRVLKDDPDRLIIATSLPEKELAQLQGLLHAAADSLAADFFTHRPQIYVGLLIPGSAEELARLGLKPGTAGSYNPQNRSLLINLATGTGTMTHEFTHALHFADMEERGQQHPMWIVEGFGSLFEQCTLRGGHMVGLVNWRLAVLKQAMAQKKTLPLAAFLADSNPEFARNAPVSYATARYVLLLMQEKGLLKDWYAQYCAGFQEDPTGVKTLEKLYGKPLAEFEKDLYAFVETLDFKMPGPPPAPNPAPAPKQDEGEKHP